MTNISENNTKAEILEAYSELMAEIERLKAEATEEEASENSKTTVCIPYIKEFAQGNELQLALRAWDKFFHESFNVVIIGDREDWMSDMVDVIECERIADNPPLDVVNKMKLAIESDLVSEKFIWSNDDQYLISPCMLADFETLKCTGKLDKMSFGKTLYQRNKKKTFEALKKAKASTWDYSTHMPFVFEKDKLKHLIEAYKMDKESYLVATMYFNLFYPKFVPLNVESRFSLELDNLKIGVYRPNADLDRLKKLKPRKKLISNSERGWTDAFSKLINGFFPKKCRFEN
jgi:hypothetical protein